MHSIVTLGQEVSEEELKDKFRASEGELHLYYGQIGSGKSYGATSDIIEGLKRGEVHYVTWPIKVFDFDDRGSLFHVIFNFLFFRKRYYYIPTTKNLHYIDYMTGQVDGVPTFTPQSQKSYIEYLNTLSNCVLSIDEAWRVVDSYTPVRDFGLDIRDFLLVTRHKFRTINLIAQRPNSVQVTARANVNRFYKFVKISNWPWIRFARYEFQEMSGDSVNEDSEPISVKKYWASQFVFDAYDSYFYGGVEPKHPVQFKAYDLSFKERFRAFILYFKKNK